MSGPKAIKHGQPDEVTVGADGGLTVYGNYIGGGGTKVVLHRPASAGAVSLTADVWSTVDGFVYVTGDAGMRKDGSTIQIAEDGYYHMTANMEFDSFIGGIYPEIRVLKNDVTVVAVSMPDQGTSSGDPVRTLGGKAYLEVGDELVLQVKSNLTAEYLSVDDSVGNFHVMKVGT